VKDLVSTKCDSVRLEEVRVLRGVGIRPISVRPPGSAQGGVCGTRAVFLGAGLTDVAVDDHLLRRRCRVDGDRRRVVGRVEERSVAVVT
jgi:hypothetical protein